MATRNSERRRISDLFNSREEEQSDSSLEEDQIEPASSQEPREPPVRRSARKKIRTTLPEQTVVENKPVRLTARSTEKEIIKYYLDKKVKRSNLSLETIYEEPQVINNEEVIMSTRRFCRLIKFDIVNTKNKAKIKKRRTRAKKIKGKKADKVTLKLLMEKLEEIE